MTFLMNVKQHYILKVLTLKITTLLKIKERENQGEINGTAIFWPTWVWCPAINRWQHSLQISTVFLWSVLLKRAWNNLYFLHSQKLKNNIFKLFIYFNTWLLSVFVQNSMSLQFYCFPTTLMYTLFYQNFFRCKHEVRMIEICVRSLSPTCSIKSAKTFTLLARFIIVMYSFIFLLIYICILIIIVLYD